MPAELWLWKAGTRRRRCGVWRSVARGWRAPLSGDGSRVLAEEQAALRRVATLVARGVPPEEVFAAVTEEVGQLLSADYAAMGRYEPDGAVTVVAGRGRTGRPVPVGGRWSLGGNNIATLVFETGRPARIDNYADASGPLGVAARELGLGSSVGTPIIVEGRLWGVMIASSTPEQPLPADTEARLGLFHGAGGDGDRERGQPRRAGGLAGADRRRRR